REEGRASVGERELRQVERAREREAPGPADELRNRVGRGADEHRGAGGVEQQDGGHERRRLEADVVLGVAHAEAEGQNGQGREKEQLRPALPGNLRSEAEEQGAGRRADRDLERAERPGRSRPYGLGRLQALPFHRITASFRSFWKIIRTSSSFM